MHRKNRAENFLTQQTAGRIVRLHKRGLNVEAPALVSATTRNDVGRRLREIEITLVAIKRALVNDRRDEITEIAHITLLDFRHHRDAPITHVRPDGFRNVRAAGC